MAISQSQRILSANSPLGKDVLVLTGFQGREEMSRLFHYTLDLVSENTSIGANAVVGKPISWSVHPIGGEVRHFHGIVQQFSAGAVDRRELRAYSAEVVPSLWLLTRTTDCRIFQNKSVPDIVKIILGDAGLTDYKMNLTGTYPTLEYCVQYRESDFDFLSRLLEEYGIFYYFEHSADRHLLMFCDQKSAYKDLPGKKVPFMDDALAARSVTTWRRNCQFRSGKWAQCDFNFETPSGPLLTTSNALAKVPGADKYEQFDYPGRYGKKPDGDPLTKVRMEEEETPFDTVSGASTCNTFSPGFKFTLTGMKAEEGKTYVLTAIEHTARDTSYTAGGETQMYSNTFTGIPDSVTYRPECKTPRTGIWGPQTAVVVGPKGEEIYTDKYGRVKVQFHWDRLGKKDENSSCWIRVSQNWAGKRWGAFCIPRIGQEVIVDFLEGDPDRPIITGRVYNAEQMHPYLGNGPDPKHPNNPRLSGIKTNTTPGGVGFNELRFDDTKGKEQIFMHAERNMDVMINAMKKETIGNTYDLHVKGDGMWFKVDHQYHETVEARFAMTEANDELHVKADQAVMVDGKQSTTVGADKHQKITGGYATDAATIHIKAGQTCVIEAGTQLSLKVGGNFIDINSGGIFIKGSAVMINSGGAAGSGSGASPETPYEPYPGEDADNAVSGQKSCP
jgi:type VI secretion system secreted protein VgrG